MNTKLRGRDSILKYNCYIEILVVFNSYLFVSFHPFKNDEAPDWDYRSAKKASLWL